MTTEVRCPHGRLLRACYPCKSSGEQQAPLPSRAGIRNPALVPTDNNACNREHAHGLQHFPSYRETVAKQPDLDVAAELLLDWWAAAGAQRVARMQPAQHFGWNDRYAGDVLFHLRRRGLVEATGRGGSWYRT